METAPLDVPVVFLIYNRPQLTERVFSRISRAKPRTLYVVAGGPDDSVDGDRQKCEETRAKIDVDWECDVNRQYYEENRGIFEGIYQGLEWVFDREERAIVLEDDCLPSASFFPFCQQLLEYYEGDSRVMSVTGFNRQTTWKVDEADYHFSHYPCSWGWATWASAWERYDPHLSQWDSEFVHERVRDCLGLSPHEFRTRKGWYDSMHEMDPDDYHWWDGQWAFAHHLHSGKCAFPSKNLVRNIGFGEQATHTTDGDATHAGKETFEYHEPIEKTNHLTVDREYDTLMNEAKSAHPVKQIGWMVQAALFGG